MDSMTLISCDDKANLRRSRLLYGYTTVQIFTQIRKINVGASYSNGVFSS